MILREFKVWGRKRKEKDSLYIWAKDADDAIGIARLTDQSICISQWTGNEKSYEEALEQEPCEDAVSRKAILDKIKEVCFSKKKEWIDFRVSQGSNGQRNLIINFIEELPSVKPVACTATIKFSKEDTRIGE